MFMSGVFHRHVASPGVRGGGLWRRPVPSGALPSADWSAGAAVGGACVGAGRPSAGRQPLPGGARPPSAAAGRSRHHRGVGQSGLPQSSLYPLPLSLSAPRSLITAWFSAEMIHNRLTPGPIQPFSPILSTVLLRGSRFFHLLYIPIVYRNFISECIWFWTVHSLFVRFRSDLTDGNSETGMFVSVNANQLRVVSTRSVSVVRVLCELWAVQNDLRCRRDLKPQETSKNCELWPLPLWRLSVCRPSCAAVNCCSGWCSSCCRSRPTSCSSCSRRLRRSSTDSWSQPSYSRWVGIGVPVRRAWSPGRRPLQSQFHVPPPGGSESVFCSYQMEIVAYAVTRWQFCPPWWQAPGQWNQMDNWTSNNKITHQPTNLTKPHLTLPTTYKLPPTNILLSLGIFSFHWLNWPCTYLHQMA